MAFSTAPLVLPLVMGILLCIAAFVLLVILIVRAALGYSVLVLGIFAAMSFIGGVILGCMGVVAMYIGKLYLEIKDRLKYLVEEEF